MCGIENVTQAQQSVMPAFAEVEEVVDHVDDIYSYLRARADGVIGRGRPERLPNQRLSRRTVCCGPTSWPPPPSPWV